MPHNPIMQNDVEEYPSLLEPLLLLATLPTPWKEDNITVLLAGVAPSWFDHDSSFFALSHVFHRLPKTDGQAVVTKSDLDWLFPVVDEDLTLLAHLVGWQADVSV